MLLCIIFGCLFLICAGILIALKIKGYCYNEPAFANFLLALTLTVGTIGTIGGINLSVEANKKYNLMVNEKAWIEENIGSEDIFISLDAHNRYFQYQFKLENMKNSKENGWIASMYCFYDIDALELSISE